MTHSHSIETIAHRSSVAIIGDQDTLGVRLANHFANLHLQVFIFRPFLSSPSSSLLHSSDSIFVFDSFTQLSPTDYLVFIDSHTKAYSDHLSTCLEFCLHHHIRFLYLSQLPTTSSHLTRYQKHHRLLSAYLKQHRLNARVVHLTHLFGPGVVSPGYNSLASVFVPLSHHQLIISGSDTDQIAPLYIHHALDPIITTLFSPSSQGNIYELAGTPVSLLNFCYQLRSLLPQDSYTQSTSNSTPSLLDYKLTSQFQLSYQDLALSPPSFTPESLQQTITWFLALSPAPFSSAPPPSPSFASTPPVSSPPETDSSPKRFSLTQPSSPSPTGTPHPSSTVSGSRFFPKLIIKIFVLLVILILLPAIFLTYHIFGLTQGYRKLSSDLQSGNFSVLPQTATSTLLSTQILQSTFGLTQPIFHLIAPTSSDSLFDLLSISQTASTTVLDISSTAITAQQFFQLMSGEQTGNLPETISNLDSLVTRTYHNLSTLQGQIQELSTNQTPALTRFKDQFNSLNQHITSYKPYLSYAHELLLHADSLLGFDAKKTYLILLQNNAELRPTGGFIGSFALVTFQNGQLLDIIVHDIYTADGQLKGHVEPPPAIKQYLGEAGWFLRDVNWDPHFPTSASRAAWFLDKEMEQKVDGVIAINLHVIKSLLEITGPVEIIDYNQTISADNLFEQVEYQVEINQFPGSTQKQDFLGSLTHTLLDRLFTHSSYQIDLFINLFTQADQRQLQVYFPQDNLQNIFSDIGWVGELIHPDCHLVSVSPECVTDYASLIEANVGVNKANYFVTREINHHTTITSTRSITHTLTLTYHNSSPSDNWPGGPYKNYLRLYTPPNSNLDSITFNHTPVPLSQIDTTLEHEKTVFGYLITVPPGQTITSTISYTLSSKLPSNTPVSYNLYLQKQSGIGPETYHYSLDYPPDLHLITTSPPINPSPSPLTINTTLQSDQFLRFEFAR